MREIVDGGANPPETLRRLAYRLVTERAHDRARFRPVEPIAAQMSEAAVAMLAAAPGGAEPASDAPAVIHAIRDQLDRLERLV
ncbi:hypothetical protein [Dactylosporangium salmoneum]|uniref:Uncharacterized protein n=1 Tax=Dactylosporangium salmoneum TaxID=53361 RepID=A0ABP5SRE8_9ACTN